MPFSFRAVLYASCIRMLIDIGNGYKVPYFSQYDCHVLTGIYSSTFKLWLKSKTG